ncbi:hypothetical protein [Phenylobacterium sp.]|uniref:hypothetical protein n=1 Tax=Phenylobacterium sp. TaxID=1871053 RepID=UPI0012234DB1|nr:hypothetical protein [Phenylobacterium sp.]THD59279.1 MAG: hypothetical protein E8A49_16855 [Phenylobacterium sp.]
MGVSTAIGTVASSTPLVDAAVVATAAFSLGLAAGLGAAPFWVLLQGAVFLVIAAANPGDGREGLTRGLIVLAGGLGEALLVALLRRAAPAGFPPLSGPGAAPSPATADAWGREIRRVLSPRAQEFRYAILLGLASGAAVLIARRLVTCPLPDPSV